MSKYSCKKASEMVEKKKLFGLTFFERIKLKLHLSACRACRSYEKQSHLIDEMIANNTKSEEKLSESAKTNILNSLKK